MNDKELLAAIEIERQRAQGGDFSDADMAEFRRLAWDYYLNRHNQTVPALAENDGVSNVMDSTVHDAINGTLAAVMPSFTSDCPATFEPIGPGDEDQAELESEVCAKVLMDDNNGYTVLYQAIKSALLLKNGVVKCWVSEYDRKESQTYDGLSADDAALLGDDVDYDPKTGAATVSRTRHIRELSIAPVDMTRFSWRAGWSEQSLDDCPFIEEVCEYTRAELLGMGISKSVVDNLAARSDLGVQGQAPRLNQQEPAGEAALRENDVLRCFKTYMVADLGDGPQKWCIFSCDQTVLDKQPVEFWPYASGTAVQRLCEFSGESLAEKCMPIQNVKTATLRALVDNLNTNNHARFIYGPGVDADDLADSGPNRHIRSINGPEQVAPVPIIDTSGGALSMLSYQDQVTSRRIGAVLELQSGESQLLGSQIGSMGADRVLSEQEQMAALMTRTLGETLVRSLFLLIHKTLRLQYRLPVTVKRGGQWQQVNPSAWPARTRLTIKTGMSAGERNRKVTNLTFLLNTQMQLMQAGSALADPGKVHKLLMDWCKAAEIDAGDSYYTDPASPEYQQAQQMMAQQAQQQQQMAMQLQSLPEQVKLQIAAMDDKREREIAALKAEIEEAKLTLEGIRDAQQADLDRAQLAVTARSADQSQQRDNRAAQG